LKSYNMEKFDKIQKEAIDRARKEMEASNLD